MKIQRILDEKASNEIYSVSASAKIAEAANMLSKLRVGALLASEDGNQIDGILSERDIVRELGKSGSPCLEQKVGDLMTENVQTVSASDEAAEALKIMTEGRFRHLPVVDDGSLLGLISIGDVVSARLKEIEHENSALNDMISGAAF